MDDVKRSWEALSKFDPLWAIASRPGKEGNRWEIGEFMQTGITLVDAFMLMPAKFGCTVGTGSMLDFGCGVGRTTVAFAKYFQRCEGVDIAEGMVSGAQKLNTRPDRVHYSVGELDRITFSDSTFDLVYSRIVLQHMPVELQARFIAEFIRVIKPGGLAAFQTPSENMVDSGTVFKSPIETPDGVVTIDMNVFPRVSVEATIAAAGGRLVAAEEDQAAGSKCKSFFYFVTRD